MTLWCRSMAGPWDAVLRDEAALRQAAVVAVDAALLEGVLMRTDAEPNASEVSVVPPPRPPEPHSPPPKHCRRAPAGGELCALHAAALGRAPRPV